VRRQLIGASKVTGRTPAAPVPGFVAPMQAILVDSIRPGDWIYEIKFDGYRALALRGGSDTRLLSRNEKDLGRQFPEVKDAVAALDVQDAIIDGEIVALDDKGRSSFQLLQGFGAGLVRPPIVFYAFDLLRLNGKDLQDLPLEERKAKLEGLLKKPPGVLRYSVSFTHKIEELLSRAQELGLEGLIGKRSGSRYEAGKRSGAWVKIKLYQEQEFVIGGYTEPEGSRKYFGALLVGFYDGKSFKFAGRVGTGFSDKLLSSLFDDLQKIRVESCPFSNLPAPGRNRWDQGLTAAEMKRCRWVKPAIVCQVRYTEWTRDDRLRHPVFIGVREDKSPTDVVREKTS
jgi:bifunctional non-homologous end joining protein LigD